MSNLLYLKDQYQKEFEAEVIEANGKYIILDDTSFYPNSGGQLFDTGIIKKGKEIFNVIFVCKIDGKISHEVDKEGLKAGDQVKGIIDWERRYKLMRSHTAAHIISQIIHQETGALITGNQLELENSRVDFSLENYNPEEIQRYIDLANKIIEKDLIISTDYISRETAEKKPELSKLAKGLPEGIDNIRLVIIGDFDVQADGGTHVKSTKEIGKITIINCKNKGKNNRRLYFKVEP